MKRLFLILLIPFSGFSQQFSGTIVDLDTRRMQTFSGSFSKTGDWKTDALIEFNENFRKMRIEKQIFEQTRLLRQIANE